MELKKLQRNLSRKGPQRGGEKKISPSATATATATANANDRDTVVATSSPRGTTISFTNTKSQTHLPL